MYVDREGSIRPFCFLFAPAQSCVSDLHRTNHVRQEQRGGFLPTMVKFKRSTTFPPVCKLLLFMFTLCMYVIGTFMPLLGCSAWSYWMQGRANVEAAAMNGAASRLEANANSL